MKVKLRNNTWELVRTDLQANIRGEIDPPSYVKKRIKLSNKLSKQAEVLEVLLHECLHGCFWDMDEEAIDKAAYDIAKVLHKLGARIDVDSVPQKRANPR
jgi:hypothetical protein